MVLVTSEMSKEEREAAINQKIEEIRKKNENITLRYQEIENDKKNAETFSQEATERMKTRFPENVDNKSHISSSETTYHESKETARTTKGLRKLKMNILPASGISDFRPQRLTENDLPPPDPVFSYLTDRLREGALCAPISPATHRKRSTSSQTSEMSIGSSSSNNSRKVSTASNSSWTSDTSSKCSGFSNYQPPRKYSACREYMKNRRLSSEHQLVSSDEKEDDFRRNHHQQGKLDQNVESKDIKKTSRNRVRGWGTENATRVSPDAANSQNPTSIEITEGFSQYRQPWKRGEHQNGFRSEYVTNWRDRHANFIGIKESGFTVDSIEDGVAQLAVFGDDLNNNDKSMTNQNMSMIETVYD